MLPDDEKKDTEYKNLRFLLILLILLSCISLAPAN